MDERQRAAFRAAQQWLLENNAEAERWLPRLLDLDGPSLRQELQRHPELRPGIIQLLTSVALKAC